MKAPYKTNRRERVSLAGGEGITQVLREFAR